MPQNEDFGNGARTIALRCGDAVNDNGTTESRVESAVLTIARLVGRQIAREALERRGAVPEVAAEAMRVYAE